MNFRALLNKLDTLNESLTLSGLIAALSGFEQDPDAKISKIQDLAKQNGFEGLVDPSTGEYIDSEGNKSDEVPFEIAEKLSAAGLLPPTANLPKAGWFDNERVFNAANANLKSQSSNIALQHNEIADKLSQINALLRQLTDLHNKRTSNTIAAAGAAPITSQTPAQASITPNFASQGNASAPRINIQAPDLIKGTKNSSGNYSTSYSANQMPPQIGNMINQANTSLKDLTASIGQKATMNESIGIASVLIESFNEDWQSDASDAARGLYTGATLGFGPDISAGVKSYTKGTKFKDELKKELDANAQAAKRSPKLYSGGEIAGSMAVPGGIMGRGLGTLGKAALGLGAGEMAGYATDRAHEYLTDKPINWTDDDQPPTTDAPSTTQPATITPAEPASNQGTGAKPEVPKTIDITEFQKYLNSLGAHIAVNGKASPETTNAIRTYILQKNK